MCSYFEITQWGLTGSKWNVPHHMCLQVLNRLKNIHQPKAWDRPGLLGMAIMFVLPPDLYVAKQTYF